MAGQGLSENSMTITAPRARESRPELSLCEILSVWHRTGRPLLPGVASGAETHPHPDRTRRRCDLSSSVSSRRAHFAFVVAGSIGMEPRHRCQFNFRRPTRAA